MKNIGVLALQGAFALHADVLKRIGVRSVLIRYPEELDNCDALIIPGGESTTLSRLIDFIGLRDHLIRFGKTKPVFGTCAGMILMANEVQDDRVKPLSFMDISISRNAYGRQVDSFIEPISISNNGSSRSINGVFIRAPRIMSVGKNIDVLAIFNDEPIFVKQGHFLATSFHPELSDSTYIHEYFVSQLNKK